MKRPINEQTSLNYLNPIRTLRGIWKYRDLLNQLMHRNIQSRYKGTLIGLIWIILTPLMMLAVYTFVFSVIFKVRWGAGIQESKISFALIMLCGMVVFNVFSESLTDAVRSIANNPNYVKKVVFPLEILPISSVFSAFFFGLAWLVILLLGIGIYLNKFYWTAVCLPVLFIPLFFICCGMAWFFSSIGVYIRDLPHVISVAVQLLYFATPVFYSIEMVPEQYRTMLFLNPLTTVVQSTRQVLIFGQWPDWTQWGTVTIFSLIVFQLGYLWFMKTKRGFADVL